MRDNGGHHHGGKCAGHPTGQHMRHKLSISRIAQATEQLIGNHARNDDDGGDDEDTDGGGGEHTLLRFLDGRRGHRFLGDILIGRPIEYLDENHAREQCVERDGGIDAANH